MMDLKKLIKEEIEDFDWAKEWSDSLPNIGDEYYFDYGKLFDDSLISPVLVKVIGLTQQWRGDYIVRFEILDEDFVQHHTELFYDEKDGWDPTDAIGLESFVELSTRI